MLDPQHSEKADSFLCRILSLSLSLSLSRIFKHSSNASKPQVQETMARLIKGWPWQMIRLFSQTGRTDKGRFQFGKNQRTIALQKFSSSQANNTKILKQGSRIVVAMFDAGCHDSVHVQPTTKDRRRTISLHKFWVFSEECPRNNSLLPEGSESRRP